MPAPILIDLTHTSHTRARTGIQRVARSLHTALGSDARAITYDPHARTWRALEPWETQSLTAAPSEQRGTTWPLSAQLRGLAHRLLGSSGAPPLHALRSTLHASFGLVVPEVFSADTAAVLPELLNAVAGPRVAIFHDAIALKFPELTPPKTVARFPAYLRELLAFDGIAAVSEDSRDSLRDYWRWLGIAHPPPVQTIPLGTDSVCHVLRDKPPAPAASGSPFVAVADTRRSPLSAQPIPTILSVGSLEGRKNHLALLDACEQLWSTGARFELRLIGLAHPQTGRAALARLRALQAAGRPLRYDGPATDAALHSAYASCAFTIYPSLIEGFGLPVIESLAHGKPCICSARGALGESARDGGCVALASVDVAHLAAAVRRLLDTPTELAALAHAARTRTFRSWSDYAATLTTWMHALKRRS
ncbi:MAG: glycosyltransferase [Verrucomicrobia bacterium]|nr:glycosyltransferase [Verrucomicrobiota bacterium]